MPYAVGDRVHLALNAFDRTAEWRVVRNLCSRPFRGAGGEYDFVVYQGTLCQYRRDLRTRDYSGVGIFVYDHELLPVAQD